MTWMVCAEGDYFDAMGIALHSGRTLSREDGAEGEMQIVVNRTFAHRYWPGEDPLGQRVRGNWEPPWFEATVVGVVEDVRQSGLERSVEREVYLPFFPEFMPNRWIVLRSSRDDPEALAPALRRELAAIDPQLPISSVFTGTDLYERSAGSRRFSAMLMGLFSAMALILISAGAYGVLAFDVVRRRHDISICVALGASKRTIVGLVLSRGVKLASSGIVIGLAVAVLSANYLKSLLYQVTPLHPLSLVLASSFLLLVALGASAVPAMRAASVDPVQALK
jgi:hypothetical protein